MDQHLKTLSSVGRSGDRLRGFFVEGTRSLHDHLNMGHDPLSLGNDHIV